MGGTDDGSGRTTGGRVRVTGPLTAATTPHQRRTAREEIDEETGVGEVYVRSLVRTQLRSALVVVTVLGLAVGTLPLVFALVPATAGATVGPVPVPWLALGVLVYPGLLALGWVYVRRAERAEDDFAELVEPREPGPTPR